MCASEVDDMRSRVLTKEASLIVSQRDSSLFLHISLSPFFPPTFTYLVFILHLFLIGRPSPRKRNEGCLHGEAAYY